MRPLDRSPAYVASFVLLLALPQAWALAEQLRLGYRPFGHAPVRVPLSWDMFSTAISRCDVRWDPPLDLGPKKLARMREAGVTLEWDPVYDRVEDYAYAGRIGCAFGSPARSSAAVLHEDGKATRDGFRCR